MDYNAVELQVQIFFLKKVAASINCVCLLEKKLINLDWKDKSDSIYYMKSVINHFTHLCHIN